MQSQVPLCRLKQSSHARLKDLCDQQRLPLRKAPVQTWSHATTQGSQAGASTPTPGDQEEAVTAHCLIATPSFTGVAPHTTRSRHSHVPGIPTRSRRSSRRSACEDDCRPLVRRARPRCHLSFDVDERQWRLLLVARRRRLPYQRASRLEATTSSSACSTIPTERQLSACTPDRQGRAPG